VTPTPAAAPNTGGQLRLPPPIRNTAPR
jgi:hypothetical protein